MRQGKLGGRPVGSEQALFLSTTTISVVPGWSSEYEAKP